MSPENKRDRVPASCYAAPLETKDATVAIHAALTTLRPYTHTDHYWQVYFDANKAIVAVNGAAHYPAPERRLHVRTAAA